MSDRAETRTYYLGNIGIRFYWSLDGCWTIRQQDKPDTYEPWLYFGPVGHDDADVKAIMILLYKLKIMIGHSAATEVQ